MRIPSGRYLLKSVFLAAANHWPQNRFVFDLNPIQILADVCIGAFCAIVRQPHGFRDRKP